MEETGTEDASKRTNKALKEQDALHTSILHTIEAERDVIGDITSYQNQLAKIVQKSVGAHDMTTSLARAQRDLAQDLVDIEKVKKKLTAAEYKSKIASNKSAGVLLGRSIALNKTIQQVSKNMAPIADFGTDMAASLNTFVTALPGGKALSKMFGIDDLSDRFTDVVNTMSGEYITALQAVDKNGKLINSNAQALQAGMKGAGSAMKAMLSPALLFAVAIAGIAMLFKGISDLAKKTATEMGVTFAQAKKLNDAARKAQSEYGTQLATLEDITAVQKEQVALLGSAALVNTKVAAGVADMGKAFGYGAEQAGKTHSALMLIGASQEQASQIQLNTNKKALEAGVSVAAVQKDIADNAAGALKYMSGSADAIADAAVKAAKLGVSLKTMTGVADALLDIEGSLTAQFEFQALTGSEINLDLARQKALQGDIAGATEEVLKNVKSSAEFDKMGVFAKQALAKATGVSVEELQKSLLIQEKLGGLTDDQKAAAANLGLSAAEMKNMSAEELKNKLAQQQSMDKAGAALDSMKNQLSTALLPLAEAFGAAFTVLGPVLKTIGHLISAILSPIQLVSNLINGTSGEMSTMSKVLGVILGTMYAMAAVGKIMAIVEASRNSGMLRRMALAKLMFDMGKAEYLLKVAKKAIEESTLVTHIRQGAVGAKNLVQEGAIAAYARIKNALGLTGVGIQTSKNALAATEVATTTTANALKVAGNIISKTGNALSLAYNSIKAFGNTLLLAANVQEGITTGAKATQLGLGTGIAAAAAVGAAATTGAVAGQMALTGATAAGAGAQAGLAAAALATNAAMTFGIGTVVAIAAAALAIGALGGYMMKADAGAKQVGDLSSPAKGTTQVSTAEGGLFETSKNDDVAAGPGILSKIQGAASNPLAALGSLFGGGGDGGSNKLLLEKLDMLIAAAKTPPPVYIGNKAVTELASALQINQSFQTTTNVNGAS